jgi:alkylhydroperoxidase family enzyme
MTRIAPLAPPYDGELQASFDRIMKGADPLLLFRTLAVSPRAWERFRGASLLDRGPLSLRYREMVIDRVCALTRCEYEWGVHIAAYAERAQLTAEQITALQHRDAAASCWEPSERVLLSTADALDARATLTSQEFDDLRQHFDEAQILEILLLCGFYRMVAYVANGLDLPLEQSAARFAPYHGEKIMQDASPPRE